MKKNPIHPGRTPVAVSRREFLLTTRNIAVLAGLGVAGPNIFLNRTKAATGQNPSEFIRVGFIGTGGQGNSNLQALMKNAVAVCDVARHLVCYERNPPART